MGVDRKTALQLLSEGCGKQLAPTIPQSVHDFRPSAAKANECTFVNCKDFGNEDVSLGGLQTKLDQLASSGIGKDSGYGDSRRGRGCSWQAEMIGGTNSTRSYPASSSLSDLAGPPLATSNGFEPTHLGQPGPFHPEEFNPEAMQLWDHQYTKEGRFSQVRSHGDDGAQVRNLTKADCTGALQLNKFQPDSMALKVAMDMKSKTNPVVQQVTTMTTSKA